MNKEEYVEVFLDYIKQVYYSGKDFSTVISKKLITTLNEIGTENLVDAIEFFYKHLEEFEYIMDTSDKNFVNDGYKLAYLLGIWLNSYKNGYVYISKKHTVNEIVMEVC